MTEGSVIIVRDPDISEIESGLRLVDGLCDGSFTARSALDGTLHLHVPTDQFDTVLVALISWGFDAKSQPKGTAEIPTT